MRSDTSAPTRTDAAHQALASTIARFTPDGADVDAVFGVKAVYRHPFEAIDITRVPALFVPRTGPFALTDGEKVYAAGPSAWTDADIFAASEP